MMEKIDKQAVLDIIDAYSNQFKPSVSKKAKELINALPTEKSYTTRNDEVVKEIEERIDHYKKDDLFGIYSFQIRIDELTYLLTKLKEDKK